MKIDYNSITNQQIKEKFVQREVLTCFSYEMNSILELDGENDLPGYDDIENSLDDICPHCGESELNHAGEDDWNCPHCKSNFNYPDLQQKEIYEWWIVTEYFYRKLKEAGQPVLAWGNNYYWGRCTTGQAILLDDVISKICEKMEILEGQKYSWADKKGA